MYLNKLENLEPYKEIDGGPDCSSRPETKKERKQREKLEKQAKSLINELPKTENFEIGTRKAVKEIKSYNQYSIHIEMQKILRGSFLRPENYVIMVNKGWFDFYVRFIGAIDKNLDSTQNRIEFEERFKRTSPKYETRKQELLTLRNKVLKGWREETVSSWIDNEIDTALNTYPTHSVLGKLYEKLKHENEVEDNVINFCLAYNEGYISGEDLSPEEIEAEYDKGIAELKEAKERNKEEYSKQIVKIRK